MKRLTSIILCVSMLLALNISASATQVQRTEPNMGVQNIYTPDSIFGDDDSIIVSSSTSRQYPHRAIAKLKIKFPNSSTIFDGTGFMYGEDVMATAAHCLYDGRYGGWAEYIDIFLGQNTSSTSPYGTIRVYSSNLNVMSGYINDDNNNQIAGNWEYDCGAIKLPSAIGNTVGWFGLDTSVSSGDTVTVSGYRAGQNYQRKHTGSIISVNTYDITYRMDTLQGQSGCPVFTSDYYVIGINNYGANGGNCLSDDASDYEYNSAARIDYSVLNFLTSI